MGARFWWDNGARPLRWVAKGGMRLPASRKPGSPAGISGIFCIQALKGTLQQKLRQRRYNSDCARFLPKLK